MMMNWGKYDVADVSRWCFKYIYCDGIALEKEADHHEDNGEESYYDYANGNFSDSDLSQSETNSDDGN